MCESPCLHHFDKQQAFDIPFISTKSSIHIHVVAAFNFHNQGVAMKMSEILVMQEKEEAKFNKDVLKLDPSAEVDRITEILHEQVLGQLPVQVKRVFKDIEAKRATRYLHMQPLLIAPVPEV